MAPTEPLAPIAQLSYDPLTEHDLTLLNSLHLLQDAESPRSSSSPAPSSPSLSASASPSSPATSHHTNDQQQQPEPIIKSEPSTQDLFQDIDGLLAGENSDQFLDSLTTGTGDVDVSIFQPLDSAGRPIPNLEIIQPISFNLPEQEEEEYRPFSSWRDENERPDWVPEWFPPFPGAEKESDQSIQSRRRKEEKERERREQQQNAANGMMGKRVTSSLGGGDPWLEAVPFSSSILAESSTIFPNSLPTPSSPHRLAKPLDTENLPPPPRKRPRRRSLSPPPLSTSLPSFNSIAPLLPHAPTYLRPSSLRRQAASLISHSPHHPELLISSDSLFGSLPYVPTLRQPTLPPGFLPDFAPPLIHAFNTNLPWTISSPVPYHSSSLPLPAPPPHSRIPSTLSQISRHLSFPLQFDPRNRETLHPNIALFSRLNRIGPPGPLGGKGETLNYEFVGNTALIAMNVEWQPRTHEMKLPKRIGGNEAEGGIQEGGDKGIKLKLGSSVNRGMREGSGTASRVGSPFAGFAGGASVGGTPGPSGLRRESISFNPTQSQSQSQVNEFDFAQSGAQGGVNGGNEMVEDDMLSMFEKNLDHFPTTDSRRNSISQQQQPFDISHLVPQSQTAQAGESSEQQGARDAMEDGDSGSGAQGEVEYPSWLLSGEQPPPTAVEPSTEALQQQQQQQSEPAQDLSSSSFSQPPEQDVKPQLNSMDYDMIDPALGGSTSTLPSLPPFSSTPSLPPPSSTPSTLPSLPSLPPSNPPAPISSTSSNPSIIRFKLKPPAPPPPPPPAPAPASAAAPMSMNMFDPSNLPPPP